MIHMRPDHPILRESQNTANITSLTLERDRDAFPTPRVTGMIPVEEVVYQKSLLGLSYWERLNQTHDRLNTFFLDHPEIPEVEIEERMAENIYDRMDEMLDLTQTLRDEVYLTKCGLLVDAWMAEYRVVGEKSFSYRTMRELADAGEAWVLELGRHHDWSSLLDLRTPGTARILFGTAKS